LLLLAELSINQRRISYEVSSPSPDCVAKYLAAGAVEDIKTVIVALQPVVLVLIGAIAYEDGQAMKAEATGAANKQQV
jgi:hypothetical protein